MKHLPTLLITLLVIAGCSTELDRCIEANTGNLENNLEVKTIAFTEESLDEDGNLIEGWADLYRDFRNNVLTDFERELNECTNNKIDTLMENMDIFEKLKVDEYESKIEEFKLYCEKNVPLDMIERATKICNSQGIY